jgi:sugar phosphate isomerase/epimerase
MRLAVCPQPLYALGLPRALDAIAELGVRGLELPVDARSPLVDLDALLAHGGGPRAAAALRRELASRGLSLSAISNHQEGQLLLGPHQRDTDGICPGDAAAKIRYAQERLLKSARLAAELEVPVLVGFVGCEDWSRFFPWPDAEGWESMRPFFAERVGALLDQLDRLGVSFAQEPHPRQIAYNTETALLTVQWLSGHRRWGFNLDAGNLLLAGCDPVVFAQALAGRVLHVHAKDGELVAHNAARSGLLAHGAWDRPDRGFRFRIPGWGDVRWKALLSELQLTGYDGWLAIEHEDPVFGPVDGLRKGVAELLPLLPDGPRPARGERWW